jgi:hypothetical protein
MHARRGPTPAKDEFAEVFVGRHDDTRFVHSPVEDDVVGRSRWKRRGPQDVVSAGLKEINDQATDVHVGEELHRAATSSS